VRGYETTLSRVYEDLLLQTGVILLSTIKQDGIGTHKYIAFVAGPVSLQIFKSGRIWREIVRSDASL
jgi:hypothetical protein